MADTLEKIICPGCGKEMKKIFLNGQNVYIDICLDGCGGILFDNREFEKCDDSFENVNALKEAVENKTFEKTDDSAIRTCSICNTPMVKMGAGKGNVKIDYCNVCGAKYLDHGELETIRNSEKEEISSKVSEVLDSIYTENFNNVTYGMAPANPSPRRQFVEDIVKQILFVI